jgi:DNA-directed RNA polymerase subunit RPC12/RpoP
MENSSKVGDRVEKFCITCNEERGHVVVLINKQQQISSVECPKCNTRSKFKGGPSTMKLRSVSKTSVPYNQTSTYRIGQIMSHPVYGDGEVTAVIEPQKIDVLFSDRLRRLVHSRV